jgi:hypothetical protein
VIRPAQPSFAEVPLADLSLSKVRDGRARPSILLASFPRFAQKVWQVGAANNALNPGVGILPRIKGTDVSAGNLRLAAKRRRVADVGSESCGVAWIDFDASTYIEPSSEESEF